MPTSVENSGLQGVKVGDVVVVRTPAATYVDRIVKIDERFAYAKIAGRLLIADGTGSNGLVAGRDGKDGRAMRVVQAREFVRSGCWNVRDDVLLDVARRLGWRAPDR